MPAAQASKKQPYQYEPVQEKGGIRLIKIEPGFGFQAVVCTLSEVSTADPNLDYQALSYT